jgi:RNA polymerase sigma-70 factor (ECF subfamily)
MIFANDIAGGKWVLKMNVHDDLNSSSTDIVAPDAGQDEQDLISAVRHGDLQAFDIVVRRYGDRIYRFIMKYIADRATAEDLTQETFISAYQALDRFNFQAKFSTWLFGIALNKIRNYYNRAPEARYRFVSDEWLQNFTSQGYSPQEALEQKNTIQTVQRMIDQLPDDMREILILAALEGCSYEEIARIVDVPVGTVKSKLFRARELIRKAR